MTSDPETKADTIELSDNEPVIFSDNPDGTPRADLPAETPANPEGDPPAEAAPDGDDATVAETTAERPRKRPRKDLQERIDKLVRERHESDEARAAAEAKAALLEQQLQEARKGVAQAPIDERERAATERKAQALKDMDLAAYDAAMSELMEIRIERKSAKPEKAEREERPEPAENDGIHPSAKAWIDRNPWFSDADNRHLVATVAKIEQRLRNEGMQFGDDLYRKIDEELDNAPEFDPVRQPAQRREDPPTSAQTDDTPADQPRSRSIVSPPTRGDVSPTPRPRPGALTKYDIETMKIFGLDHNNPKVREAYLARKSKSA